MMSDVRRAYFYAKIQRDVYIEVPKEDPDHGKGMLGKLKLCLYEHAMQQKGGKKPSAPIWRASDSSDDGDTLACFGTPRDRSKHWRTVTITYRPEMRHQ